MFRTHGRGRISRAPRGFDCRLLVDGQKTCYFIKDSGGQQEGQTKRYTVRTTDVLAGTVNVDNPEYAAATIAFVATTDKITDSANGLAIFLTGDTIRIRGSDSHDTVYTVKTGGVAGEIVTNENITVGEAAGAYITICKRATHSNNTVRDEETGLEWARYVQTGLIGPASDGELNWYDTTKCYTLHPAAADLQMLAGTKTLKIIGGAAEVNRYFVGMVIVNSGFAVACNNLPGYVIQSVTVNGADLDLVLGTGLSDQTMTGTTTNGNMVISGLPSTAGLYIGMAITGTGVGAASVVASIDSATQVTGSVNSTADGTVSISFRALADEAAGVNGVIKIVCQNTFAYAAAANVAGLGGYSDWRVSNMKEIESLVDISQSDAALDKVAFPSFPSASGSIYLWSSSTLIRLTTYAYLSDPQDFLKHVFLKTDVHLALLVRGG